MGVDEFADRRIETRLPQRLDHQAALPCAVMRLVPMLHGAAAAHTEMRTDRRDARGAFVFDIEKPAPVGMAGDLFDLDCLARQGAGHVDGAFRALRDAVAAVTDADDFKPLNHAPPR